MVSRNFPGLNPQGGFSDLGQGLVLIMVKRSPGVHPKPRFGPILDSTVYPETLPRVNPYKDRVNPMT